MGRWLGEQRTALRAAVSCIMPGKSPVANAGIVSFTSQRKSSNYVRARASAEQKIGVSKYVRARASAEDRCFQVRASASERGTDENSVSPRLARIITLPVTLKNLRFDDDWVSGRW